jgi:uncharacterized protein (TIGR00251 family)
VLDVTSDAVVVDVHVQPGARRSEVRGRHGDALAVRVAAPPDRGRANEALLTVLAEFFHVPRPQVELVAGHTSRRKRVALHDVDATAVRRSLDRLLAERPGRESRPSPRR